jgi:pimeloyl-ACP methyl ester carboxylesterase
MKTNTHASSSFVVGCCRLCERKGAQKVISSLTPLVFCFLSFGEISFAVVQPTRPNIGVLQSSRTTKQDSTNCQLFRERLEHSLKCKHHRPVAPLWTRLAPTRQMALLGPDGPGPVRRLLIKTPAFGCRSSPFGLLVFASLLAQAHSKADLAHNKASQLYGAPSVTPSQILRARGFHAQDHHFVTKDNYRIRLTRGLNPLINRGQSGRADKIPILFVHGILESANVFLINSFGATPKDFGDVDLAGESLDEVIARLAAEPSAKSLPLLALNHGHEVWLMSRRGFPGSQTKLGDRPVGFEPTSPAGKSATGPFSALIHEFTDFTQLKEQISFSFDRNFWNYSLDEQAEYDLPQAIDYVLAATKRMQLSVVGHSAGGALTLMALSSMPELNHKVNSAILWAGTLAIGQDDVFAMLAFLRPALERFIGAVPPIFLLSKFQALSALLCVYKPLRLVYARLFDLLGGDSGGQAPVRPEFVGTLSASTSSRELAQILQNVSRVPMRRFDHGPAGNRARYGRDQPHAYELGRVRLERLSLYVGATDFSVSPADVERTRRHLRPGHRYHLLRAPFNHNGFFFHTDNGRLAVVPSLREIQHFSRGHPGPSGGRIRHASSGTEQDT